MLFKLPTCSSARASMVSPIAAFDHKTAKNRNPKYQRIRQSKHWEIPSKMFCIKITMVIKMGRCGFKISNNPYRWEISQSLGDCWPPQKKTVMQWLPDNNKGHSNKHESRYGVHLSMDCFIRRPLHFHWALFQNIPKCMTQTRTWRRIFFAERFYWFDCQNLEPTQSLPQVPSKQLWDGVNNFDHFFREFGG